MSVWNPCNSRFVPPCLPNRINIRNNIRNNITNNIATDIASSIAGSILDNNTNGTTMRMSVTQNLWTDCLLYLVT